MNQESVIQSTNQSVDQFIFQIKNFGTYSPQANYTGRATAACRRSWCQILRIEGAACSAQRIPTAVTVGFLDRSRYFSIQVAPQLSSRGWVDPVPDPLLLTKSGSAGNWTRNLWICSREFWPLHHRGGTLYLRYNYYYFETSSTLFHYIEG
jgi:hypothetical protein